MEVYFCDFCFYKLNSDDLSSKIKTLAKNERQKISISVTRETFRASKKSTKDPDNEKKTPWNILSHFKGSRQVRILLVKN